MSVTGGSQDFENTFINREKRDIKGTPSKIVNDDLAFTLGLVKSIGDGSSGGLIDDSKNVQTRNRTGILCSLTLGVIEAKRG